VPKKIIIKNNNIPKVTNNPITLGICVPKTINTKDMSTATK
jgi:hypothetical protein